MKNANNDIGRQYEFSESEDGHITLHLRGKMDARSSAPLLEEMNTFLKGKRPSGLTVDLKEVSYLDDFGTLVLVELRNLMIAGKGQFRALNANESISEILSVLSFDDMRERVAIKKKPRPGVFIRLGEGSIKILDDIRFLVSFIGSVFLSLFHVFLHPRSLRMDDTVDCMHRTGVDALPIVGLISFLLGLIMAFMSAVQLEQFGANIYVASLVSLAMTRELGPIMTAIIVAGRSGSAFAAEIGTMQVSEEVDALFTMGFDPTRFLVVPKIIASVIVVPLLTLFSDMFAIMGGLIVGIFILDLTANAYMVQTIKTLSLFDVFYGFMKAGIFAFLIAWVGCLRGFRVRGGAAAVGQATTSAVVSSIFLIILTNSVFSVILRYW